MPVNLQRKRIFPRMTTTSLVMVLLAILLIVLAPLLAASNAVAEGSPVDVPPSATVDNSPEPPASSLARTPVKDLPFRKSEDDVPAPGATVYLLMLGLLGGVIVVLFAVRKQLVRKGAFPAAGQNGIRYLEKCRLNTGTYVYLVAIGEVKYVIAENGSSISLQPFPETAVFNKESAP